MKDIVIQQHLLAGYLWMKQNAMALRDGGEVHPAFRWNWGTCHTMRMYGAHLTPIGGDKLGDAHDSVLGEYIEEHMPHMIGYNWPFGIANSTSWENPQRLAFVDWAIAKLQQEIAV